MKIWQGVGHLVTKATAQVISGAKSFASKILLSNGSASAPSLCFIDDEDTGFYKIGANNIGFSANGVKQWDFAVTYLTAGLSNGAMLGNVNSTYTTPSISPHRDDIDTGMGSGVSNSYSLIAGGIEIIRGHTTHATIKAQDGAVTPATNGSIAFYLDETNNKLKVAVKYADGTAKTGEVNLT